MRKIKICLDFEQRLSKPEIGVSNSICISDQLSRRKMQVDGPVIAHLRRVPYTMYFRK